MPYLSCPKQLYRLFPCNSIKRDIGQHSQYLQFFRLRFSLSLLSVQSWGRRWLTERAVFHFPLQRKTLLDALGTGQFCSLTKIRPALVPRKGWSSQCPLLRCQEDWMQLGQGAGHIRAAAPLAASWAQPQCRTPVQKCSAAASAVQLRWITNDVGRLLLFVRNVNDCTHNLSHICKASFG